MSQASGGALPAVMTAIEIAEPGGPEVLRPCRRPLPAPGPGEVLIQVTAAGVNRPDLRQRSGHYPPPAGVTDIPGLEVSGRIVALGPEVEADAGALGRPVCALVQGGGYAQYCVAPLRQCLPIPAGLEPAAAAALPETFFTVWTNVFERGRLAAGETLLVHGGASGIGTTAIQLARALGARVIATAGSAAKCEACRALGAELAIDYRREDFARRVLDHTGGRGADVILDMVRAGYLKPNLDCLAVEGRLVIIAFLGGREDSVPFAQLVSRRQTITGSTLRPQSVEAKARMAEGLERRVWPLLAEGRIRPVIFARFPLAEAAAAHAALEAGDHVGKILLEVA